MEQQTASSLGQWLKGKCQEEGLSLRQVAAKSGLSHTTISALLKGGCPSGESIKKLAVTFGGNGHRGLALEDKLLILTGYRTARPDGTEPSEALAQLLDKLSQFNEAQLAMVGHFADFIYKMEQK